MNDQTQTLGTATSDEVGLREETRKVLIVDDDFDFGETLREILETRGYEVAVARNPDGAMELGGEFQPHIALIDIRLGRDSGIDLIKRIRESGWKTLCIMVTAYGTLETAIGALHEGAYDYLRKPVDATELFSTLERCFERNRLEKEKQKAEERLKIRNRELEEINHRLRQVVDSARRLSICTDLDQLGPLCLREFSSAMSALGGSLYFIEEDGLRLVDSVGEGELPDWIPFPLEPKSGFAVARRAKQAVFVEDIEATHEICSSGGTHYHSRSFLILPLLDDRRNVLGLVALHNKSWPPFTEQDRELGEILASLCAEVLRELTSRKALQESEERFRTLVSNLPGTVYRCRMDPESTMEYISENVQEICGYPATDFLRNRRRSYRSVICEEDRERVSKEIQERVERREPFLVEYRVNHADGSTRWVYEKGQPIFDVDGNLLYLDGVVFDITDRKKLQEDRDRLFNLSLDMFAIGSYEGRLIQINPAWKKLGWTEEELTSQPYIDFIHPDDRDATMNALRKLKEGIHLRGFQNRFRCKNGEYRWISWNSVSIPKENLTFSVARDITDLKKEEEARREMEMQAQRTQKMESLGVLAGGIAHDFNNILSGILGYTNLTLLDLDKNSMAYSNLLEVTKAANRASDLVQQILAFSRQSEKKRRSIRIDLVFREALKFLRASLPSTIEIDQTAEEDIGYVLADPTEIHQVIMNLCTNACHAMEKSGGELKVSLEKVIANEPISLFDNQILDSGGYALLRVEDTGEGISSDIQHRIFEPFFTTKEVGKGTGMGLSVVHGVVTRLGGAITCKSTPGVGTVFEVFFPLTEKQGGEQTVQEEKNLDTGGGKILLVDDEEMIVRMGKRMLERQGYEVVGACTGPEALEVFRRSPDEFDLVITDHTMPKMTGDILATKLLEIRASLPIILTTGLVQEVALQKANEIGIREVILKPFRPAELVRVIQKTLAAAKNDLDQ